jgi:hypothetical protein
MTDEQEYDAQVSALFHRVVEVFDGQDAAVVLAVTTILQGGVLLQAPNDEVFEDFRETLLQNISQMTWKPIKSTLEA